MMVLPHEMEVFLISLNPRNELHCHITDRKHSAVTHPKQSLATEITGAGVPESGLGVAVTPQPGGL